MTLDEAQVGRTVIYTPYREATPDEKETGVITSKNDKFVFVRYGADPNSKATNPEDLTYQ